MGQPREGPVQTVQPAEQDPDWRLQGSKIPRHDNILEHSVEMQIA